MSKQHTGFQPISQRSARNLEKNRASQSLTLLQSRPFQSMMAQRHTRESITQADNNIAQRSDDNRSASLDSSDTEHTISRQTVLPIQAKLTLGQPNDKYEQEADRVAAQVVQRINSPPTSPQTAQREDDIQRKPAIKLRPLQRRSNIPVGPVNNDFETSLNQARGNGSSLAPDIRTKMESAIGADFGSVKVHTDGPADQLSQSIQAKAFTTGQDIFFKKGEYNPNNRNGQELLAHELTHVVQQKDQAVTASPKQDTEHQKTEKQEANNEQTDRTSLSPVDISKKDLSIQCKKEDVLITGLSHLVKMEGGSLYEGEEGQEIIHGQQLSIETDSEIHSRRGPNQEDFHEEDKTGPQHYKWYEVLDIEGKAADKNLYVREDVFVPIKQEKGDSKLDQVNDFVEAITDVPGTLIGNEGISGLADALNNKTVKTNTGNTPKNENSAKHATNMGIVADGITGVTGLLGLAKGFKDLSDPEKEASDVFVAFLDVEEGAMKTGESVSKLTNTLGHGGDDKNLAKLGSGFEGFGAAFGGIKEAFFTIKDLVELIKEHQDYTTEEKAQKATKVGLHALETAKSVVLSVKSFIEMVEGAASGGLMATIPGLDIAVAGAKLIMNGYYCIVSNANRKTMNKRRQEIADEKKEDKEDMNSASEFYRSKDAEIANKKAVIKETEERLKNVDNLKKLKFFSASKKDKEKERQKLLTRKETLEQEIKVLEQEVSETNISREDAAEFALVTELRDANTKRVTRQSVHISTEMTKIGGAIATLTGVGAVGGAIAKGSAAAVELSLPAARMAKQAGRDRAARKMAKGKQTSSSFDHTKSTAAKADYRLKQVKYLIRMIVDFSYETDEEAMKKGAENIRFYLKAAGMNEKTLFKENGNPQKQIKMLVEAIQQREFLAD